MPRLEHDDSLTDTRGVTHSHPHLSCWATFPRTLVARIVITSKCSIIVFVKIGFGSLCIPAAGATTHPRPTSDAMG